MTFSYAALAEEFSNFMQCTMFFQFGVVRRVEVQSFQKSLFSDATIAGWIGLCSRMWRMKSSTSYSFTQTILSPSTPQNNMR